MFEIDWTTDEDRRRRRYKASTIHGWLRMWRGTLAGNERVRQQGRHEMKEASARRAYRRKQAEAAGGNGGPFSLFRWGSRRNEQAAPAPAPQRHKSSSSRHHRNHGQSHHAHTQRKSSSGGHHRSRRGQAQARPEPTRQRSSHSARSKHRPSRQSSGRR